MGENTSVLMEMASLTGLSCCGCCAGLVAWLPLEVGVVDGAGRDGAADRPQAAAVSARTSTGTSRRFNAYGTPLALLLTARQRTASDGPAGRKRLRPLLEHRPAQLRTGTADCGEAAPPLPRAAGVPDQARVEYIPLLVDRVVHGIHRACPAAVQHVQAVMHVRARADGPEHLIGIARVDVVVDDDDQLAGVG